MDRQLALAGHVHCQGAPQKGDLDRVARFKRAGPLSGSSG